MKLETLQLDATDRRLVNLMQAEFPISREPFADFASMLSVSEDDVLERVIRLRDENMVRVIGPVFNSRTLGYTSTLVAMRVPAERIEQAARIINDHSGVGHDYQRDHFYNLWFTLAINGQVDLAQTLRKFQDQIRPEDMVELQALRLFKIRLFFDMEGNGNHAHEDRVEPSHEAAVLSDAERVVINGVQQQLPVMNRPFDAMAAGVGMEPAEFLAICLSLKNRGIMRRFGASIEHQNAGFVANAMVCWAVPDDRIEEVGNQMAAFKEVTHCYERKLSSKWPKYNIFTMIHGQNPSENAETVRKIIDQTGIAGYETLKTVREFKKQRVKYRV